MALLMPADPASASSDEFSLFTHNGGSTRKPLLVVDPESGMSTEIAQYRGLSFSGFATRPNDGLIYGVSFPASSNRVGPARLYGLEPVSGSATEIAVLDNAWFGFDEFTPYEISGIAIASTQPNTAVLSAKHAFDDVYSMIRVDLETSELLSGTISTDHDWGALTFTPDGQTLLGATGFFDAVESSGSALYEIDPLTGDSTRIGLTGSRDTTGLAYHPATHELLAINAFRTDALVVLDPETGQQERIIGGLGLVGPEGLAFLPPAVPEPSSIVLLALGGLGLMRRRRANL